MKHKKQNSEKKRFWLGMMGCALVSFTAYAVSYFSSSHIFSNEYNANKNYSVEIYDVMDENSSSGLRPYEENRLNADLVVKNTGGIPVLLRIKYNYCYQYSSGWWDWSNWWAIVDAPSIRSYYNNLNLLSYYTGKVQNEDKFLFNGETEAVNNTNSDYDGYYYYRKVLQPNQSVQHLDDIYTPVGTTSYGSIFYYQGVDDSKEEIWKRRGDTGFKTRSRGKMLWGGSEQAQSVVYPGRKVKRTKAENLRAKVETIRAVKSDGNPLEDKDLQDLDSVGLKKLWESMI